MSRRSFAAIVTLGITLAASVAAHQGTFEYWKAGAQTSRSKSGLPHGHSRVQQTNPSAHAQSAPQVTPWTEAWFSDSTLIRHRIGEMTEAMTIPMIGEAYPLPRGGGFVCSRAEGGGRPSEDGLICVLQCTGPEFGARRHNWFYVSVSSPTPTLDRVRWVIVVPSSTRRAPWRAFFLVLADSLSGVMGQPVRAGPDSMDATWNWKGHMTTMRLHADPTRVDSLEMECVSERLAKGDGRERMP